MIKVVVAAEDGNATATYTLTVTRAGRPGEVLLSRQLLSVTEGNTGSYSVVLNRQPAVDVQVKVRGHAGTNVTPSPTNLNFTPSNWRQLQWVSVSTDTDANTTNESVRLNHTAVSSDSLFDGVTVPSVIVNVDDQDAPDHHIHTIRVPQGSHALDPGDKVLPEEEFEVETGPRFGRIEGVAEGHIWRPSGLWGDPDADTVWVVDPNHFGIHPLKLSALKQGRIERHVAADASELDYRLNYRCHFNGSRASGYGNPSLTVMWGTGSDLWIANESSGTLDAYSRTGSVAAQCKTRNVTSWDADGQGYEWADETFSSPFSFLGGIDVSRGPLTVSGIWSSGNRVWLSGPSSGLSAGGVYTFGLGSPAGIAEAPGYDGHIGSSYGLWSDGTTMWVGTNLGWLRAYNLNSGIRSAEFDIRIKTGYNSQNNTYGMPPGDMWSDGETIWVTNRTGKIDAYHLPDRPYASSGARTPRATEAEPLTASFALAPEAHDGENGFKLRIAFSDAVEITAEDMRDHALQVSGGTVTGAATVKGRSDLWELTVQPAGPGPVSILASLGRACADQGALCTADGRSLTAGPALVVPGPPAAGPPEVPDQPEGTAVFVGGVDLEWNEVPGAGSYDVQQYRGGGWTGLPADGVAIAFYGAGAIISGLDPQSSLWFRVRAANGHGVSDWSAMLYMNSTSQFRSGRQARPDNEPAGGAPVLHGTAQVGESLWADATGIEDGNGLDRVQFRYQWVSGDGNADTDIAGATDSGYTLVSADVGRTIKVRVAFTDRGGYSETRTGAATGAVAAAPNNPATGAPTITGTAQVGEELTADTSRIADNDGLTNATYSYQWLAGGTGTPGATGSSYTLTEDDEGLTIQVLVGFTDDAGNEEALASAATGAVSPAAQQQAANSPATGAPTITGTAQVGEELTADTSGITDTDGLTNAVFAYQWLSDDAEIGGATDSTYTLVDDDAGQTIKVRVLVTDDLGNETTLTSAATDAVDFAVQQQGASNTPATGAPTITGTAQVGEELTADTSGITDTDGLTNAAFAYQWLSDDAEIGGATDSTYTLVDDDEGQTIKVRVTATDDAENETTLTSAATEAVAAAPQPDSPATGQPTISGTAQVGEELTADTTGVADTDGLTNAAFAYQWLSDDAEIGGATDSTYTLVDDDEGQTIKVRVTVTDDAENETTLTSTATAVVAAPEPPAKPTGLSAAVSHDTVTLIWDDPQDDSITGYVILRRDRAIHLVGTFITITGDTGSADTTYTDETVEPDKEYVYRIKAINEHGEVSEESHWVRGFTPAAPQPDSPATGQPTISGTAQVGEMLTADTTGITDDDGLVNATFSYQWVANDGTSDRDIFGAADNTYTLVDDDEGQTIKVRVIVTDDAENETTLTSEATDAVEAAPQPDSPATGQPTISGTARVGEMLTADTSGIADADGLTKSTYSYQWVASDGATDTDISGAADNTYTLVDDDEGRTIKVRVIVTDDAENETTLTSEATDAVEAAPQPNSPATGQPTISGMTRVGEMLTADTSGIADADGLTNVTYSYQWLGDDTDIAGATSSTYTLVAGDEGRTIKVRVIVTDDAENETTLTSEATEAVAAAPQPDSPATGQPAISGMARVGEELTADTTGIADTDGLTNAVFAYQWLSDDAEIGGATDSTYTLVDDDEGQTIKVRVTVADDLGNETTLTSAATEAVDAKRNTAATGRPTISGTVRVGETLTADTSGIADDDGLTNVSYSYQWVVTDGGAYIDISGETGSTYTLVSADRGLHILVRVSFTDDAGKREKLASAETEVVAAAA